MLSLPVVRRAGNRWTRDGCPLPSLYFCGYGCGDSSVVVHGRIIMSTGPSIPPSVNKRKRGKGRTRANDSFRAEGSVSLSLCDKREELNCSGWRLRTSEKRYEAKPLKSRFCPVTTSADGQIFNQTLIALSLTLSLRSSMQRLLVKTREIPHFPSPRCVTLSSDTHNVG